MAFLRAVHEKVNIIPVIGKADALLPQETQALKQKVGMVTSDLWPQGKPKAMTELELGFDFVLIVEGCLGEGGWAWVVIWAWT